MYQSGKDGPHFEKWVTPKKGHNWKNGSPLEKWVRLEKKWATLVKMGHN